MFFKAVVAVLPWRLRRHFLQWFFGYELHADSRIGFAWVYPRHLKMGAGTRIGHLTVVKGLDRLVMAEHASIGRMNWISGYPSGSSPHFAHQVDRRPELAMATHSAITNRHIVDCTDRITIGAFATVAGFRSQLLTHSINLQTCRQEARPISIGAYCFIGTACTLLGGSGVPDYSVLGANSLLNKCFTETHRLYACVPAAMQAELGPDLAYFRRDNGFVI
jgi:acetyltransferase-like isoleucine patch superfamily enzyme